MKKITKAILIIFLFSSLSFFNSCDELGNIPLNIPFNAPITAEGTDVPFYGEYKFCLNRYEEWQNHREDIQSARYISAAFWTNSYSPSDLKGTITAALIDKNGKVLFSESLPNASPGDFMAPNPYKFDLTKEEIDELNAYLGQILQEESPDCNPETFTARLTVTDVTGNSPFIIDGKVEIVIEAEISTN